MIDYMTKKRARLAAQEYMDAEPLRSASAELSDHVLANKFGCGRCTIKKVREGIPVQVLDRDDQELIRKCAAEKAAIDERLPRHSKTYLAKKHRVTPENIDIELQLAGWEQPKKAGAVA